MTAKI